MSDSQAVDIADVLAGVSSLALTLGDDLHVSQMPATGTIPCVAVLDSPVGVGPSPALNVTETIHGSFVQIRVRGDRNGYQAARALAGAIKDELHGLRDQTINGTRYILVWAQSDVLWLGYDENQRPEFSINFRIQRA